jgi:hypothetical protein
MADRWPLRGRGEELSVISETLVDVICGYLHIEPEGFATLLDLARRKLNTALSNPPT